MTKEKVYKANSLIEKMNILEGILTRSDRYEYDIRIGNYSRALGIEPETELHNKITDLLKVELEKSKKEFKDL